VQQRWLAVEIAKAGAELEVLRTRGLGLKHPAAVMKERRLEALRKLDARMQDPTDAPPQPALPVESNN
jgi:hypothetical protein